MTPEETQYIDQMTSHMKSHCVGRYVIGLPESFVLNSESNAEVEGVKIKVVPMSEVRFKAVLAQREAQLRKKHMDGKVNTPYLLRIENTPSVHVGFVFNRAESTGSAGIGRTLELLSWKGGYEISMSINATDGTHLELDPKVVGTPFEASEKRVIKEYSNVNDVPQKLAHLLKVYERVRGRGQGEIPAEQGLCIANGFVAGPPVVDEGVQIAFDLKGTPDVYFNFTEDGTLHEKTTLLQRSSQVESEMSQSGTQTVRKGQRTIDGHPYEEWLMKGPTPAQVAGTMFTLHGNEVAEGAAKPFVSLVLYNGFRVLQPADLTLEQQEQRGLFKDLKKATLSEAEAVALWDKVTATLRPRPGAF